MTKKDYEAIASIIRHLKDGLDTIILDEWYEDEELIEIMIEELINQLSNYFWTDNAQFDKQRFKAACQRSS